MTYKEAEAYLYNLPRFALEGAAAYEPGLARIASVLEAMGNPQDRYPIVHIAGTNGKGSTASFLSAITIAAGKKTGLHTSPHLFHVGERMRVNGIPAGEAWIAGAVARYAYVFKKEKVSFFEATVALSLYYFADQGVDLAIVEVGLGGRLDATNIVSPDLAIITSIGLDHTEILGNSIRDITREKAGIIKPGIPVLSGVTQPEAKEEIGIIASQCESEVFSLDEEVEWIVRQAYPDGTALRAETVLENYVSLKLGLPGEHQVRNSLLALFGAELLFSKEENLTRFIQAGLEHVTTFSGIRGRLQVVQKEPLVVLDVGHNSDGVRVALAFMAGLLAERQGRLFVMFGTMRDKNVHEIAEQLSEAGASVYAPPITSERAIPSQELAVILQSHNVLANSVSSVDEGLTQFYEEANRRDGILIIGSHLLVAQFPEMIVS